MNYFKITFEIQPDNQDYRDLLIASLADLGYESFVENDLSIEAYIPEPKYDEPVLTKLDHQPLFSFTYKSELIPDQNWNEVWEKNYFKPLLIAGKCLVRAPFHSDYPEAEIELVIEPKMAFGTGNHETTALMIELLLETKLQHKTVLDMGCGTGILSMLASKLGAKQITAIDIDEWPYESTVENCALNNCINVKAQRGDAGLLGEESYEIILANIHKNVLINDMASYCMVLDTKGLLFMSGFYENDLADITAEANRLGLKLKAYMTKNNWVAASFEK